jgi:hypothetical protein
MCTDVALLAEKDADQIALDDLSKQSKEQSGANAEITKSKVNELRTQIKAEKEMKAALKRAQKEFLKSLESAVKIADPLSLLALSNEQLNEFIKSAGFSSAIVEFINQSDNIDKAINKTVSMVSPIAPDLPITQQLDLIKVATAQAVFDDVIIPSVASGVRDSLTAMSLQVPAKQAISGLAQKMNQSTGTQLTVINTKLSMYGRSVSASLADAAGLNYYLYTGPRDGLTRPFCKPLINKVVSESQMNKLNNGQGLPVKTAGGGYNCRHSWTPVSEGFIGAANLQKATSADINKANARKKT